MIRWFSTSGDGKIDSVLLFRKLCISWGPRVLGFGWFPYRYTLAFVLWYGFLPGVHILKWRDQP